MSGNVMKTPMQELNEQHPGAINGIMIVPYEDDSGKKEIYFTGVYRCPFSGEYILAGNLVDKRLDIAPIHTLEVDVETKRYSIYYYKKKQYAKHACAAKALDCYDLRNGVNKEKWRCTCAPDLASDSSSSNSRPPQIPGIEFGQECDSLPSNEFVLQSPMQELQERHRGSLCRIAIGHVPNENDEMKDHAPLFTGIYCCPFTGEYILAGHLVYERLNITPIKEIEVVGETKNGTTKRYKLFCYAKKKHVQHACAAKVLDCYDLRNGIERQDWRCRCVPYRVSDGSPPPPIPGIAFRQGWDSMDGVQLQYGPLPAQEMSWLLEWWGEIKGEISQLAPTSTPAFLQGVVDPAMIQSDANGVENREITDELVRAVQNFDGEPNDSEPWVVNTLEEFGDLVKILVKSKWLLLDFEMRMKRKDVRAQTICFMSIQANNLDRNAHLDALAPGIWAEIPSRLKTIFEDPNILKFGHSVGGLDIRCLYHDFGITVVNCFDIQIGHAIAIALPGEMAKLTKIVKWAEGRRNIQFSGLEQYEALKETCQTADFYSTRPIETHLVRYMSFDVESMAFIIPALIGCLNDEQVKKVLVETKNQCANLPGCRHEEPIELDPTYSSLVYQKSRTNGASWSVGSLRSLLRLRKWRFLALSKYDVEDKDVCPDELMVYSAALLSDEFFAELMVSLQAFIEDGLTDISVLREKEQLPPVAAGQVV